MLTRWLTPELLDEVLGRTGRVELRRRLLPARAVMYFVLALCLFGSAESAGQPGYRAVLRTLTEKLRHLPGLGFQRLPTSSALTRARQRLGEKPLHALFEETSGPLATPEDPRAFAFGLRIVAWDGTTLDVPDTGENVAAFGFTNPASNTCGSPQVRLMALVESGTHALIDAAFERWEIENGFAELKNRLRGAGFTLRSKSPELVAQEVYALLTVYHALCALEYETARQAGIDLDRISFSTTVLLVRLGITSQAAATANRLRWTLEEVAAELLDDLLPTRRDRRCERVKRPPKNKFAIKRRDQPRTPSNVRYSFTVTRHRPLPAETA